MDDVFKIPDFLRRAPGVKAMQSAVRERQPKGQRAPRKVARRDKRALRALGYSESQIVLLGTEEAQFIILKGTEAPL